MPISDDHVAALRAMLIEDFDEYESIVERMERANSLEGLNVLVAAAFYEAVQRRFGHGYTTADIIHFVADERARFEDPEDRIDPRVAERLTLAMLGSGSVDGLNERAKAHAQLALLMALVNDENLDSAGVAEFVTQARKVADATAARLEDTDSNPH